MRCSWSLLALLVSLPIVAGELAPTTSPLSRPPRPSGAPTDPRLSRRPQGCRRNCDHEKAYICGTDGVTYENFCFFDEAVCGNKSLAIAYRGGCGQKLLESATAEEDPECGTPFCTMEYDPRCGSDGVTYGNKCQLENAKCANPQLTMVAEGECSGPPPGQEEERCERPCTREYRPVCGSDGVTYSNTCEFKNAKRCKYGGKLRLIRHDKCPGPKPKKKLACALKHCPEHRECRVCETTGEEYCADVCDAKRCGRTEQCILQEVTCVRAPCPPIATCITKTSGMRE